MIWKSEEKVPIPTLYCISRKVKKGVICPKKFSFDSLDRLARNGRWKGIGIVVPSSFGPLLFSLFSAERIGYVLSIDTVPATKSWNDNQPSLPEVTYTKRRVMLATRLASVLYVTDKLTCEWRLHLCPAAAAVGDLDSLCSRPWTIF